MAQMSGRQMKGEKRLTECIPPLLSLMIITYFEYLSAPFDSKLRLLLLCLCIFVCVCQVLSVLTHSTLVRTFKAHRNFDLRRPLSGAEKFFDNLLNLMDVEPGLLLTSVRCLPLDSSVRDIVSQTIVQHAKVKVRVCLTDHCPAC